jgi:hypothetical protein
LNRTDAGYFAKVANTAFITTPRIIKQRLSRDTEKSTIFWPKKFAEIWAFLNRDRRTSVPECSSAVPLPSDTVLHTAEARLKNVLEFSGSKKGNRKWQSARF